MSSRNVVDLRQKRPGRVPDQEPLPLRPQKRISPVRIRRRRTRLVFSTILMALIVAAVLLSSYVSYLPRYTIQTVQVQGAQAVSPIAIADYAELIIYDGSHHFFSRANSLIFPQALIEKYIPLEFPRIASATVTQDAPMSTSITITVVERQPYALWCASQSETDCYSMDANGFLFAQAPQNAIGSGEYVFTGGISTSSPAIGQTFAPGHTQGLVAFLQLLNQSGYAPLGATVNSDQDFSIPVQQGFSIYASFGEDPGTLAANLRLVLSSSALSGQLSGLEYVDLRFGNKIYYKLKGKGQSEASSTPQ